MTIALPLLLAAAPLLPGLPPAAGGVLTVQIDNVRAAKGHVRVDVCPQAHFLKEDCPYAGSAVAVKGTTIVTVRGLPPGRYAVQAYLDENDNRAVDRGLFGIPKEGIGFSNDARILFAPPKFTDAVFPFDGTARTIRFKLRYFL